MPCVNHITQKTGGRKLETIGTKEQKEKEATRGASQGPGAGPGIYVSLHGRFVGRQSHGRIRLPGNSGQGLQEPDARDRRQGDRHMPGKDSRTKQHHRQSGQDRHTAHSSRPSHGFRDTVRHEHIDGDEEYSSTCCGKCQYFFRPWRSGVWVCSNEGSEKNGLPTNYASTCPLFTREDWQRDEVGCQKDKRKSEKQ